MKLAGIDFPDPVLDALRDGNLVVFAGAGVSKPAPADLPDFKDLAKEIAEGSGETLRDEESLDHFLGRLKHPGAEVHKRAKDILTRRDSQPTELHKNLLRLYPNAKSVRIVTTNFDCLFEQAAKEIFDSVPEVFRAPALPLGQDFKGIVHVHGSVSHPDGMVLTDGDFGRSYVTEGRASRFLVDLFRRFTVLFVGYKHDDTIMNYLARALSEAETTQRFALAAEAEGVEEKWNMLGIKPILFQKSEPEDYDQLYRGIEKLVQQASFRILDWKQKIENIAKREPPPSDNEDSDLLNRALKDDVANVRFFTAATRNPAWIKWLDREGHLANLFNNRSFNDKDNEQDAEFSRWLAENFAYQYPDEVFQLIGKHKMQLHPSFWFALGRVIGLKDLPDENVLSRWVSVLLDTAPKDAISTKDAVPTVLLWLGERCVKHKLPDDLLRVFDALAMWHIQISKDPLALLVQEDNIPEFKADMVSIGDYHNLSELWEGLKSELAEVAEDVLERLVPRWEEMHSTLCVWGQAHREWEPLSFDRSAIEPHPQDRYPESVDVLIDAMRDCLEWLAKNKTQRAECWCARLADSDAPLLRRLAVHGLSVREDLNADDKVDWLLGHVNFHDIGIHHEIFQAMKSVYPETSLSHRERIIAEVKKFQWPKEEDSDKDKKVAYEHFNWLAWLNQVDPDCELLKRELDDIRKQYTDFKMRKHPDFTSWSETCRSALRPQGPWSVEELLSKPATNRLDDLLSYQPTNPLETRLHGLLQTVTEASKTKFKWGIGLAEALGTAEKWDADLWGAMIRAWAEMDLDENEYKQILRWLAQPELYSEHSREVADALYSLVKDGGKDYAMRLLPQAEEIASRLWGHLKQEDMCEQFEGWIYWALDHPAGTLALFWLSAISRWRKEQNSAPDKLPENYRHELSNIVEDATLCGRLGRTILARGLHFLVAADEAWTKKHLLPLFETDNPDEGYQAVWDGFLYQGRITPTVADLLAGPFLKAVEYLGDIFKDGSMGDRQNRFIADYLFMINHYVPKPLDEWIPKFFEHGDEDARRIFAERMWFVLKDSDGEKQKKIWQHWLKDYWKNRLDGIPKSLEPEEVAHMIRWLSNLAEVFPEAVGLAVKIRLSETGREVIYNLDDLNKGSLCAHHPEEVARLLIWLGRSKSPSYMWHELPKLVQKLRQAGISQELEKGLQELLAKLGLDPQS